MAPAWTAARVSARLWWWTLARVRWSRAALGHGARMLRVARAQLCAGAAWARGGTVQLGRRYGMEQRRGCGGEQWRRGKGLHGGRELAISM